MAEGHSGLGSAPPLHFLWQDGAWGEGWEHSLQHTRQGSRGGRWGPRQEHK